MPENYKAFFVQMLLYVHQTENQVYMDSKMSKKTLKFPNHLKPEYMPKIESVDQVNQPIQKKYIYRMLGLGFSLFMITKIKPGRKA